MYISITTVCLIGAFVLFCAPGWIREHDARNRALWQWQQRGAQKETLARRADREGNALDRIEEELRNTRQEFEISTGAAFWALGKRCTVLEATWEAPETEGKRRSPSGTLVAQEAK